MKTVIPYNVSSDTKIYFSFYEQESSNNPRFSIEIKLHEWRYKIDGCRDYLPLANEALKDTVNKIWTLKKRVTNFSIKFGEEQVAEVNRTDMPSDCLKNFFNRNASYLRVLETDTATFGIRLRLHIEAFEGKFSRFTCPQIMLSILCFFS